MNRLSLLVVMVAVMTLWFLPACVKQKFSVIRVAHLCDPQLGFETISDGDRSFENQVERLEQAVRHVNRLAPDLVVIAGDFVNDISNEAAVDIFRKNIAQLEAPVLLTPGNHDIPDPVNVEGLQRYHARYGDDFCVMECKGRCIISANSQFWRTGSPSEDSIRHENLLRDALKKAKKRKQPIVILTHVPPFILSVEEADEYYNLPHKIRKDILDFCNESGVIVWLAGHTHTAIRREYGNISILNGETTSVNFDNHPFGFRLLTIYPDQHFDWDFIELESVM